MLVEPMFVNLSRTDLPPSRTPGGSSCERRGAGRWTSHRALAPEHRPAQGGRRPGGGPVALTGRGSPTPRRLPGPCRVRQRPPRRQSALAVVRYVRYRPSRLAPSCAMGRTAAGPGHRRGGEIHTRASDLGVRLVESNMKRAGRRARSAQGDVECRLARSVLSEWVDGDLPPKVFGAITAHVASCRGCGTLAVALRTTLKGLVGPPAVQVGIPAPRNHGSRASLRGRPRIK